MGDSKDSLPKLELNENKMHSVKAPDLLGNTMCSKESLDVFRRGTVNASAMCDVLPPIQITGDSNKQQSYAQHHEKFGSLDLIVDAKRELFGFTDGHGNTFTKFDGKWSERIEGEKQAHSIENLKINKDGSYSFTNELGKFSYDSKGQLTEAPAGDGHSRKYHYNEKGELDKIDGRLGHWEREVKDGHVCWVNKNNGAIWKGDFTVKQDMLEFHAENGVTWGFTAQGKDVQVKVDEKHKKGRI